jgi:drug/metabolite transporter (DMT)-like permease
MTRPVALFVYMCLIWGLTWIAMKVGVAVIPPVLFAALRFTTAGVLLLAWRGAQGGRFAVHRGDWLRLLAASLFIITFCYAPLFWGIARVASGLAATVNLALVPVGLFLLGLAYGEERFSRRQVAALCVGFAGLALLFAPKIIADARAELAGNVAIIAGTFSYCWGSILSRPLLRRYSSGLLAGLSTFIGGLALAVLSLLLEPGALGTLGALADPAVLTSFLFLVLFGSLAGYTIYLRLLRDWGAARVGMYAFVTPVVAVIAGVLFFGERFGLLELAGMAVLLIATSLALHRSGANPAARRAGAGD